MLFVVMLCCDVVMISCFQNTF